METRGDIGDVAIFNLYEAPILTAQGVFAMSGP